MPSDPKAYRLPMTVRPTRYDIALWADLDAPQFRGHVSIALRIEQATDRIELHARDLHVHGASLSVAGTALSAKVEPNAERETVAFTLARRIPPGDATLELDFEGSIAQGMSGLYLSKDASEACLATQCEATDARAIFPCFDEPAFKAQLAWSVTTPRPNVVLANGAFRARSEGPDGAATWSFHATPPIASYLAAVAVGPFAACQTIDAHGVPFAVWALGGKEKLGAHANRFTARLLPWYESYFGLPYAYGKYDQVAVPSFAFGAMENAGLVVFRASLLLMDPVTASWQQQKHIDLVVAHEFAHMWFGNLVTMAWWDDLWLNEAFAEWIAHKAVDELEPTHQVWYDFQGRSSDALETDALDATHAIYHPVATPAEATEMFDAITYGKGSAVMRMLEAFLGADAFRAGLRSYMQEFKEGNAAGPDLWRHLARTSDAPVARIMENWIRQKGHPLVEIGLGAEAPGRVWLTLRQERARSTPSHEPTWQVWEVPLVVRYADDAGVYETRHLLAHTDGAIDLPIEGRLRWAHANAHDIGFYRTHPDDELLARLVANLDELGPGERVGLLRDQWMLVRAGRRPLDAFAALLERMASGDDHHAVVEAVVERVRELEKLLETKGDDAALVGLRRWSAARFRGAFDRLGVAAKKGEPPGTGPRRAAVLRAVAAIGRDAAAVELATGLAERERAAPASVDADVAGLAVAIAAAHGDAARHARDLATYNARRGASAPPQESDRYLGALVAYRDPALVRRTLALTTDGTLPNQAIGPVLSRLLGEPHAQRLAWTHLVAEWKDLRTRLGDSWIARVVEAAGALPPAMHDEIAAFFDANLDGSAQQALGRCRERLVERGELLQRVGPGLARWAEWL